MTEIRRARSWSEIDPEIEANETEVQRLTRKYISASRKALLEDLRKEKGLTQSDLAELLGVHQSRVSRIEKSRLDALELRTLQVYAEALGGRVEIAIKVGKERITLTERPASSSPRKKAVKAKARARKAVARKPANYR